MIHIFNYFLHLYSIVYWWLSVPIAPFCEFSICRTYCRWVWRFEREHLTPYFRSNDVNSQRNSYVDAGFRWIIAVPTRASYPHSKFHVLSCTTNLPPPRHQKFNKVFSESNPRKSENSSEVLINKQDIDFLVQKLLERKHENAHDIGDIRSNRVSSQKFLSMCRMYAST